MQALRAIPGVVLVGGLTLSAVPLLDMVRSTVVGFELAQAANLLYLDWVGNCQAPPRTTEQLGEYLRQNSSSRTGRDVSRDYWDQPYVVEWPTAEECTLLSTGPNQQRDVCARLRFNDRFSAIVEAIANGHPETPELGEPEGGNDDICVHVEFGVCQSNAGY